MHLSLRQNLLCIALGLVLAGCGAMTGKPAPGTAPAGAGKSSAQRSSKSKPALPREDQLGRELDRRVWKIQCSNADLAMMCRKADPTDRRCARKQAGRYRWTYGKFCKRALACSRKACR